MFGFICALLGYWLLASLVCAVVFSFFLRPKSKHEIEEKMREHREETIRRLSGEDKKN
jgi:hypothetical protein